MRGWTPDQQRAWDALGIGPSWEERPAIARPDVHRKASTESTSAQGTGADPSPEEPPPGWELLRSRVASCQACPLGRQRKQAVFGSGTTTATWAIVGEAPGAEEDERGEAFVGQAGILLDAMLASMGWSREKDFFIANVLKCRPPANRTPLPNEIEACAGHLQAQMQGLQPRAMLILGRVAAQHLSGGNAPLAQMREHVRAVRLGRREIPAVVSFHPAYLLRYPQDKAKAWEDLHRFAALSPG